MVASALIAATLSAESLSVRGPRLRAAAVASAFRTLALRRVAVVGVILANTASEMRSLAPGVPFEEKLWLVVEREWTDRENPPEHRFPA
jgi:hypothetical protein